MADKFQPSADKPDTDTVSYWLKEVGEALKREKKWRKKARKATELFEGEEPEEYQFNILYSNTETLAPALMNSNPRPRVKRRFKDADPLGKSAAELTQRTLSYLMDTDLEKSPSFYELVETGILGALVPGRGLMRVRYDATFAKADDGSETVSSESVICEDVPWNRFIHGYAAKWADVPWVAFEWPMTEAELKAQFPGIAIDKASLVDLEAQNDGDGADDSKKTHDNTETKGAWVYEIWDKGGKKVLFLSASFPDKILKQAEDPLHLSGFFPCPEPLRMTRRINSLLPQTLYVFYEEQAKELNRVTRRINKLIAALKVRGFYDSTVEGIDKVLSADDNELIPAENVASLQQGMSMDKAIYLLPIDALIAALQQLYLQRDRVKQVIYEITGIADIMRGSTAASETLGAQQIKTQWGTLRLKRSQAAVQRYIRSCLRIMAEIAVTRLSPGTLLSMTGLKFPTTQEQQVAQQTVAQAQQAGQQPDPSVMQVLAQPSIDAILAVLKDDLLRSYHIDIETNSTIEEEVAEDKSDMAELMNALSQFLNGVAPLVASGSLPFEAAKALLMGIVRRFRFGSDIEDLIGTMQPPQPPAPEPPKGPSPEVLQMQAQNDAAAERLKQQTMALQAQHAQAEHEFKLQELSAKGQLLALTTEAKRQALVQQMQRDAAKNALDAAKAERDRAKAEADARKPAAVPKSNTRG